MISISGIIGNNVIGYFHSQTKVTRAIRRKSADFLTRAILRNVKPAALKLTPETELPVLIGNPDVGRLINCFKSIAQGLYFHEYQEVFKGQINMLLGFLHYEDPNNNTLVKFIRERFELEERALQVQGENPSVFKYQFCSPDEHGFIGLKLLFYGGSEVFISFLPEGKSVPFDLGMELMKGGVPSTFMLKDKKFEFNVPPKTQ